MPRTLMSVGKKGSRSGSCGINWELCRDAMDEKTILLEFPFEEVAQPGSVGGFSAADLLLGFQQLLQIGKVVLCLPLTHADDDRCDQSQDTT